MKTKSDMYADTAAQLAPLWDVDQQFLAEEEQGGAPGLWSWTREMDDWLVRYRNDQRISVERYARNCERLVAAYMAKAKGGIAA